MSEDSSDKSSEDEDIIQESDVKFCIKCKESKLSEVKSSDGDSAFLVCRRSSCFVKMKLEDPSADVKAKLSKIVEKVLAKKKKFKYCFRCGEQVLDMGDKVVCSSDDCEMSFLLKPTEQQPKENVKKKLSTNPERYETSDDSLSPLSLSKPAVGSRQLEVLKPDLVSPSSKLTELSGQQPQECSQESTADEQPLKETVAEIASQVPAIEPNVSALAPVLEEAELRSEHRITGQIIDADDDSQLNGDRYKG